MKNHSFLFSPTKCQQFKHGRDCSAKPERAPWYPEYEGTQSRNKQWDVSKITFNGFCPFIVAFITWSHSCFWTPRGVLTFEHVYLQTSLTICTAIDWRDRTRDSGAGWSESFKGILEVCGSGIVHADQGEGGSSFYGMLDWLRDKRDGLKQEKKTGWLCAHMCQHWAHLDDGLMGLRGL